MSIYYETQEKCNYCGEVVAAGSRRCPYCGSLLDYIMEEEAPGIHSVWGKKQESSAGQGFVLIGEPYDIPHRNTAGSEHTTKSVKKPLSNGKKVFITIISTIIPGIGQLIGVIISILFMNNQYDEDKRSFGAALLVSSLIIFLITCFFWFIILLLMFSAR